MESLGFKRAKPSMSLQFLGTVVQHQKERWSQGKSANLALAFCLWEGNRFYEGFVTAEESLRGIWDLKDPPGCLGMSMPALPHGFMVLQGQEGYPPPLVPMEIAAALQGGLAENSFWGLTGLLHFPILL